MKPPTRFFNPDSPTDSWRAYLTWSDECDRGLVHTEAYDAEMRELEKALKSVIADARLVNRIDTARAELEVRL